MVLWNSDRNVFVNRVSKHHCIILSMFMLSFIFVTVFLSGSEYVQDLLSFVYRCIAVGDPVIKRGGLGSH